MPKLVQLYIRNVLIGFAVAAAFVALLLWLDVMNLWHLISGSDAGVLAVVVLWFAHGIVFAGVQFAWAVMAMAERNDDHRGGTPALDSFHPVPVEATTPKPDNRHR